jgi:uncharacterized protein (DUF58 family)
MQGDNLRHVDWKVWGRTDKLYIKQFQDDTNLACQILLDTSASMDFGQINKFHYGRMLAAALAYLMVRQHDAAGLTLFSQAGAHALPAQSGPRHLDDLFQLLARSTACGTSAFGDGIAKIVETFNRRGLTVIISDFLSPEDPVIDLFRRLQYHHQEIIVFHLLSAEEIDFNYDGECVFEDAESGEELPVHASAFRKEYLKRVSEFRLRLAKECEKREIDLQSIRTDTPLAHALSAYLEKRLAV